MSTTLSGIALRRLSVWTIQSGKSDLFQSKVFSFEVGQLGFKITNPEQFTSMSQAEWTEGLAVLKEMRGADVSYVPLFSGFPDQLPNDGMYFIRRVMGFLGLNTFNAANYGADPITQMQNADLWQDAVEEQSNRLRDSRVEWMTLTLADEKSVHQQLSQWAIALLYGRTPIQETLWDDLLLVKNQLSLQLDLAQVTIKETLARLAAKEWETWGKIVVKTPTDLLRMFAFIKKQDVSLATAIDLKGMKLSKAQRREIVRFLNGCPSLREDLLRYKGLWMSLFRSIHPGDFAKQYPSVAAAFDDLRNDRIQSFESQLINSPIGEKLATLMQRPSLLLRHLTRLMKEVGIEQLVESLDQLDPDQLPLTLLMQVYTAVRYEGLRLVINKAGKPYCIGQRTIKSDNRVLNALESLICTKLKGTKDWTTVWIDPAINKLVLPLQMRKQSDGLLNLARGSRIAVPESQAIRLFVYWQQTSVRTDLDLSVLTLDKSFKYAGHVSWSQYGDGDDIAYSGDIQSAPLGATEFIDLKLSRFEDSYILPVILKFVGEDFTALKACSAGWMNRSDVGSDALSFDPRTVVQKVSVSGDGQTWTPFLFDVANREIVVVDLYGKGQNTVERNPHFAGQAERIAQYHKSKPTYGMLAQWMVKANGAEQVRREEAEVTIGVDDDCSINVLTLVGEEVTSLGSK
jgi:hypothetical protein